MDGVMIGSKSDLDISDSQVFATVLNSVCPNKVAHSLSTFSSNTNVKNLETEVFF